ncbi:MAG: shikimate dehydrogenase [Peptostreptococcaceae bacterium]|jgi:shikimate dehydrogenase|nr:shikimate dehydrogenase [Peptostreptococcaceae bacterium]
MIDDKTRLIGLIGEDTRKTSSPFIHNKALEIVAKNYAYLAFDVKDNLDKVINGLKYMNIKGLNITIPYKEEVIGYIDELDELSNMMKSVNTIKFDNGKIKGFNTDGLGFYMSLKDEDIDLKNKNILILGAGGAARGIAFALSFKENSNIDIVNRNYKKAQALVLDLRSNFKDKEFKFNAISNLNLKNSKYDIVINTTSLGMYPNENKTPILIDGFKSTCVFCDIVYKPHETLFLKEAKKKNHKIIYGINMLIYQALLAQEIWFDYKFEDINLVKEGILKDLKLN